MSTDAPATVTVKLEFPVTFDGKTISELTFRRRKAKDLIATDLVKGETRKHMAMMASMADIPLPVIEDLDADDWEEIAEATIPLLGKRTTKLAQQEMARLTAEAQAGAA
ncbi:Phage tail assembly chaperone protein, E, or 41 or 14 [Loktanella atrilutea]|uniref:Phage tail assembly chaperone protein, E, or 41 or 14 n=1 Tax=Loktanella atrilutea TaxID=366533 RepID=A0A1M4WE05_LOKAT|nr:phage tail assembly protein [Loktanella atrilutea]SHE79466.1 Phage tail assembly chaperone protein, E, or 41 or 14 [Loktanella atrilutea]